MSLANVERHQINFIYFLSPKKNICYTFCFPFCARWSLSIKAVDIFIPTFSFSYLVYKWHLTRKNLRNLKLNDTFKETLNLEFELLHKKVCISLPKFNSLGQTLSNLPIRVILHNPSTCNKKIKKLNTYHQI